MNVIVELACLVRLVYFKNFILDSQLIEGKSYKNDLNLYE